MFEDTLALKDNPFFPRPDKLGRKDQLKYTANLDRQPLRMDQVAALGDLFHAKIANIDAHELRFDEILAGLGYDQDTDQKGYQDVIVLLKGAEGVGKTTLASYFMSQLKNTYSQPWGFFELERPSNPLARWTVDEFKPALEKLKKTLDANAPVGDHLLLLLEDVGADTFPFVLGLYDSLAENPKIMFVTTHDLELMQNKLQGISQNVETFALTPIVPGDAEAFVKHRLEAFRDPVIAGIPDLYPLFPWSVEVFQRQVTDLSDQYAAQSLSSPITLRVLSSNLRRQLGEHHKAIKTKQLRPVSEATIEELKDYMITP